MAEQQMLAVSVPQHDNVWQKEERGAGVWETRGTATRPSGRRSDPKRSYCPGYWDKFAGRRSE